MKTCVGVRLQYEALHCWKDCPLEEVSFLKSPHRHMFHITVEKEVVHDDRDVEIILLKRKILEYLGSKYRGNFQSMSCEMIAFDLLVNFKADRVEVSEDGENYGVVYK